MKNGFLFLFLISFIILISLISPSCANIIPPSGGPRDSLPPVLVNSNPKDSTTNFKGRRIVLTFNEYIDLQDVQQNLLFTPTFETNPIIEAKLRTITLRLHDSLQRNTTYSFNFGNAVRDVNEGNILRNFTYVFSTGSYLDSLQLRGKVILAENGKTDSTLIVVLHTNRTDSAVAKQRPPYAARVDSSGNFVFKNLPRDTFAIYAIGDAGLLRRYTSKSQAFAFADAPVISGAATPVILYAYKETNAPLKPVAAAAASTKTPAPQEKRLRLSSNLSNNQQDLLTSLKITSERPLRNFDSARIRFTMDSAFVPVAGYHIALDSTKKNIVFTTQWTEGKLYHLIIDKDFAEDTLGRKLLRADTIAFTTKKQSDYGSIRLRIRNIDTAQNPVLQFIQNDLVVKAAPVKSGFFSQPLFLPGDYELRILYDKNNNGKWDPGHFFGQKIQPEIVHPIKRKINVKPAWENEYEVTL